MYVKVQRNSKNLRVAIALIRISPLFTYDSLNFAGATICWITIVLISEIDNDDLKKIS